MLRLFKPLRGAYSTPHMRSFHAVSSALLLLAVSACTTSSTSSGTGDSGASSSSGAGGSSSGGASSSGGSSGRSSSSGGSSSQARISTITGRLLSPNGAFGVFDGAVWVEWMENGQVLRRQGSTRFDGRFTLNGVPAGTHTLHGERGIYAGTREITLATADAVIMDADILVSAGSGRFVIVDGLYDDIGEIVEGLGLPTVHEDGIGGFLDPNTEWFNTVFNETYLQDKTAVMLNCGVSDEVWEEPDLEARRQMFLQWIASGHSAYVSDWAYDFMEWLFPDVVNFQGDDLMRDAAQDGDEETVLGTVTDETLEKIVGRTVTITYDLPAWAVMAGLESEVDAGTPAAMDAGAQDAAGGTGDGGTADGGVATDGGLDAGNAVVDAGPPAPAVPRTVTVLVRGTVHARGRELADVPLAVKVRYGQGTVVFTTFHNEAQLDASVLAVLRYMIMRL